MLTQRITNGDAKLVKAVVSISSANALERPHCLCGRKRFFTCCTINKLLNDSPPILNESVVFKS
jgi:hypothetical protein